MIYIRIDDLMKQGLEKGCTHFLLSPTIELYYTHIAKKIEHIIPLFSLYLDYCFNHSLIGKIGYI